MACRIVWAQTAIEDLKQIVQYIGRDNTVAATNLADRILHRIERAAELPCANRVVPEKAGEAIREIILSPYRIIYLVDSERSTLHILRISGSLVPSGLG